ncbi:MAG: hypothetical protein J7K26_02915 [Candidatus Aenigmarchaeota archaeon]|nr:hypothetical protein [Candidatus Aenigmarchaeota archaeon]
MKGFIYLIEIAVAGILIAIILSSLLSAQEVKTNWDRAELIETGNDIIHSLKSTNEFINIFNSTVDIDKLTPPYVNYTIKVYGIPKNNIKVGTNREALIKSYLDDVIVNNRKISYDVTSIDYDNVYSFDVLVFVDEYDERYKNKLIDFSKERGIVGINFEENDFENFYYIGNDKEIDNKVKKYFKGIGFFEPASGTTPPTGSFDFNGDSINFIINDDSIEVIDDGIYYVGDSIIIGGYEFTIKKIDKLDGVWILPEQSFVDQYFSGDINNNKKYEYTTLIQSTVAVASINSNGWILGNKPKSPNVYVPTFIEIGNDIPEIAETDLILWYAY